MYCSLLSRKIIPNHSVLVAHDFVITYSNGYRLGFLISVYLSGCTLGFKLYLYGFRDDLFDN